MLKLYGFKTSNYYSVIKLILLEKGLSFEEAPMTLNNGRLELSDDYLNKSPIGKVPSLETNEGVLSETSVIIDYLDSCGGRTFYPSDHFARAKVRELIKYIELYLELPARRLYGEFFGRLVPEEEKRSIKVMLESGFDALTRLATFGPYLTGSQITYADFFAQFTLTSVTRTTKAIYGWDTYNSISGLRTLLTTISERQTTQQLMLERQS